MPSSSVRPVFMLTLEAKPGTDPIRALRSLLKIAGRQFHLRCVDAYEITQPQPERTRAYGNTNRRHGRENAFHRNSTGNDRAGSQDGRGSTTGSGPDSRKAQGLGS